jgi:hypothetical protein
MRIERAYVAIMSTKTIPFAVSDLLPLSRAARLIQSRRGDRPTSGSTLFRWATRGIRGVTLRTWRLGRTIVTTEQALREFILATSPAAGNPTEGSCHE